MGKFFKVGRQEQWNGEPGTLPTDPGPSNPIENAGFEGAKAPTNGAPFRPSIGNPNFFDIGQSFDPMLSYLLANGTPNFAEQKGFKFLNFPYIGFRARGADSTNEPRSNDAVQLNSTNHGQASSGETLKNLPKKLPSANFLDRDGGSSMDQNTTHSPSFHNNSAEFRENCGDPAKDSNPRNLSRRIGHEKKQCGISTRKNGKSTPAKLEARGAVRKKFDSPERGVADEKGSELQLRELIEKVRKGIGRIARKK
jgi:hypothetical protein